MQSCFLEIQPSKWRNRRLCQGLFGGSMNKFPRLITFCLVDTILDEKPGVPKDFFLNIFGEQRRHGIIVACSNLHNPPANKFDSNEKSDPRVMWTVEGR
jgi:hypothetical protein